MVKNNLKEYRLKAKLTQKILSKLISISTRQYQEYEYNKYSPNIYTAIKIANILKVKDLRNLFPIEGV